MFHYGETTEDYLVRKLAHLLFEVMEFPRKRDTLYIALCYCQLSNARGTDEIPLYYLSGCMERYLIDLNSYPWRDFLLEYEIFGLRTAEGSFVYGADIINLPHTDENSYLTLKSEYKLLRRLFCKKILKYWKFISSLEYWKPPRSGGEVISTVKKLTDYHLFEEANLYLEQYLPFFTRQGELLQFRFYKLLNLLNTQLERENYPEVIKLSNQLEGFISDFKDELLKLEIDVNLIKKGLKDLRKRITEGRIPDYLIPTRPKKESFWKKIKNFLKLRGWKASD